jgi:hypothetical protein
MQIVLTSLDLYDGLSRLQERPSCNIHSPKSLYGDRCLFFPHLDRMAPGNPAARQRLDTDSSISQSLVMLSSNVPTVVFLYSHSDGVQALLLHTVKHADHARPEKDLGKTDLILFLICDAFFKNG